MKYKDLVCDKKKWKITRQKVFDYNKGICQWCGERVYNHYTVHHKHYNTYNEESMSDLVLLHGSCHNLIHRIKKCRGKTKRQIAIKKQVEDFFE